MNLPQRFDLLTGYEPNRPQSPRDGQRPYGAASFAVCLRPPGLPVDRVPFYSSLVFIDEKIHLQIGQEEATAARRVYEVDQINLHWQKETALRKKIGEIQFEQELSLQAQQHLNFWEQEKAAAATTHLNAAENRYAQAAATRLLMVEEEAIQHHQDLRNNTCSG